MQGTARSGTARAPFPAAGSIPDPLPASESRGERAPRPAWLSIPRHRRVPEPGRHEELGRAAAG